MAATSRKLALLCLKYAGGFWLARRLTAGGLRILCYHGMSLADEHEFRGRLFMQPRTFRARMRCLQRLGYPILPLDAAVQALRDGALPPAAVVLTFDDGWHGAYSEAFPLLRELGYPATLYVATYYSETGTQVFNVTVRYLFWKTRVRQLSLPDVLAEDARADLTDPEVRERTANRIIRHGNALAHPDERQALLRTLGEALDVDIGALERAGAFRFASIAELAQLADAGIDVQLHTHHHSGAEAALAHEIIRNRRVLGKATNTPLTHFCYPGGHYSEAMWPTLEELDIESATTCDAGFNYADTHRYALRRILDEEQLSALEFEAELSGVLELWKRLRSSLRQVQRSLRPAH